MRAEHILLAAVALVLSADSIAGHSIDAQHIIAGPTGTDASPRGSVALAACQDIDFILPSPCVPADSSAGSSVGALFDVRGVEPAADLALGHVHPFAHGTCRVETFVPGFGVRYHYLCGTDRNDDGLISDLPVCMGESDTAAVGGVSPHDVCSGQTTGSANEDWADDWVTGDEEAEERDFCFQQDIGPLTATPVDDGTADVSPALQAGGGWDLVYAFVKVAETGDPRVGAFVVSLEITGATSDCSASGQTVSGHGTVGNAAATLRTGDPPVPVHHAVAVHTSAV